MKPDFNCYSMRLAGFLMMKGFILRHMFKDKKTYRFVYIFNDDEELQKAIKEYKERK